MLDTNFIIAFTKDDPGAIHFLKSFQKNDFFINSIVEAELYYGVFNSAHPTKNLALLKSALSFFQILPFDSECAYQYGQLRLQLKKNGTPIGPNDLFIASIALAHQCTIVTRNLAEFSKVESLKILNF